MRMQLRAKPWPMGAHPPRLCPVCEEPWHPWAMSRLPCHARCLFTEQEQDAILNDSRRLVDIAAALRVSINTVRAAERMAWLRRGGSAALPAL